MKMKAWHFFWWGVRVGDKHLQAQWGVTNPLTFVYVWLCVWNFKHTRLIQTILLSKSLFHGTVYDICPAHGQIELEGSDCHIIISTNISVKFTRIHSHNITSRHNQKLGADLVHIYWCRYTVMICWIIQYTDRIILLTQEG